MNKLDVILPKLNDEGIFFDWPTFSRRKIVKSMSLSAPNDLYISVFGREKWPSDREPMNRDKGMNTLMFVLSGKGWLETDGERHELTKGSYFLLRYGRSLTYGTDPDDPWEYIYFDIGGINQDWMLDSSGFGETFVHRDDSGKVNGLATDLYHSALEHGRCAFRTTGLMYMLADAMSNNYKTDKEHSVNPVVLQAMNYIGNNFVKISTPEIAAHCGISVTYLNKLFRRELGMTPIEFVTYYRAMVAESMLRWSGESLKYIASRVGYNSEKYLIKVFKAVYGTTPEQFRAGVQGKEKK